MATKSSRRGTTVVTQQSSSFTSSARSPSPTRISRLQEKQELGCLNDRLANYIDKVRSLELENSRLSVQVRSFEETSTREVSNVKKLYEQELNDARKLLDDLGKEKARLQIELSALKTELSELRDKYSRRDRDATNLEKKLNTAEAELADLRAKYADANQKRQNLENENKKLRAENTTLDKQLGVSKKELENETLMRVDLENRVQSLNETLKFNESLHQQQLNETKSRTEISMTEVDDRYQHEYDNRLAEALKEMRGQHEFQAKIYREEMETMFEKKLSEMRVMAERNLTAASSAQEELKSSRRKLDELGQQCTQLTSENDMLRKRVKELENQLDHEQEDHQKATDMYRQEIKELRQSIEDQMREYSDLMDIKIALDMEISAYRKLIEGEEERLNLSSQSESSMRRTPVRATPTRGGKRKRVSYEGLSTHATDSSKYAVSKSAKGAIEITDTNEDGKFIKLTNTSEKDQGLAGWHVQHTAGEMETVFKLPRSVTLKPKQSCTIWSSDGDGTHSPPSDIVMKGQRWFLADSMKTVLLNKEGEEIASNDLTRSMLRTFQAGPSPGFGSEVGREDLFHQQGDPQQRDKCAIM
ncbi:lamin Dm0-like isoform X2 [Lineus longissimus]|uniref:lamin Dm0-like isoform X2 n=1 Tax=Lineus longissimus TaxID=88925 RepID=UPI002B4CF995